MRRRALAVVLLASTACGRLLGIDEEVEPKTINAADASAGDTASVDGGDAGGSARDPFVCPAGAYLCDDFERQTVAGGPVEWATTTSFGTLGIVDGGLEVHVAKGTPDAKVVLQNDNPKPLPLDTKTVTVDLAFTFTASTTKTGYTDFVLDIFGGLGTWVNFAIGNRDTLDVNFGPIDNVSTGAAPGVPHRLVCTVHFGDSNVGCDLDGMTAYSGTTAYPTAKSGADVEVSIGVIEHGEDGDIDVRYEHIAIIVGQ